MDKQTTWADWIASRTIKFNATLGAIMAAVLAYAMTLTDADLIALGVTPSRAMAIMAAISLADKIWNIWQRTKTSEPLAGRAHAETDEKGA